MLEHHVGSEELSDIAFSGSNLALSGGNTTLEAVNLSLKQCTLCSTLSLASSNLTFEVELHGFDICAQRGVEVSNLLCKLILQRLISSLVSSLKCLILCFESGNLIVQSLLLLIEERLKIGHLTLQVLDVAIVISTRNECAHGSCYDNSSKEGSIKQLSFHTNSV